MTDDHIRTIVRDTLKDALAPVREAFADLRSRMTAIETRLGLYASDEDLDGPRGNPTIRFTPKRFRGPGYVGKRYSEASPEFLDAFAEALQWMADNPKTDSDEDAKKARWNLVDAARARSWARRIRSGAVPPPPEARALAGEAEQPSAPDAPSFEAPAFEAPSFDDVSDADEDADTPMF